MKGLHLIAGHRLRSVWQQAAAHPSIKVVALTYWWKDIQPTPTSFKISALLDDIAFIRSLSKKVSLRIYAGAYTPAWVYNRPGVRGVNFVVENEYRAEFGENARIPVPWDDAFLVLWGTFLNQLSEAGVEVDVVHVTGPNMFSSEMHLPRTAEDKTKWVQKGYTRDKMILSWVESLDAFAVCWPQAACVLDLSPVIFEDGALEMIAEDDAWSALQNNILTPDGVGAREDWAVLADWYAEGGVMGFQRNPPRIDPEIVDPERKALRKMWFGGYGAAGILLGASYLEVGVDEVEDFPEVAVDLAAALETGGGE